MLKNYAIKIFKSWTTENLDTVFEFIESKEGSSLVDLGCGDGFLTKQFVKKAKATNAVGVDGLKTSIKGVKTIKVNLNSKLPLPTGEFDAVISHYSLEHLYNSGEFIYEIHRILKKNGYAVIATDNLSSWPNIFALILGYQPFSTTMGVGKNALGNPLALRMNMKEMGDSNFALNWRRSGEFSHNKVMAYRMLIDAFEEYGFKIEEIRGIGYFIFFGRLSKWLAKLDKRHAHLIVLKVKKV